MNDPDVINRHKMKTSFDPFDPNNGPAFSGTISPDARQKGGLKMTLESKQLRALDSPKSVQSNPKHIPENE